MKVVIIGSGNVATVLGKKIMQNGHTIVQVVSRNEETAAILSSKLNCSYTSNILEMSLLSDIYIIAVADNSIEHIASNLTLIDKVVVHTAAAVPQDVLSNCSSNYGVLYPLQTLKKELEAMPVIPVLFNANNDTTANLIAGFAASWANSVTYADDTQRLKLHLAAVFANNFVNHLLAISNEICAVNSLNSSLLMPLIEETIARLKVVSPVSVQTGPAVRNDQVTIEKHREMLQQFPSFLRLYNELSYSIISMYVDNKG